MNLQCVDLRIKLFILLVISSTSMFLSRPLALVALLVLALLILIIGGMRLSWAWLKVRGLLGIILILFLIQCLLYKEGEPLFSFYGRILVTDSGFKAALYLSWRLFIIVLSLLTVLSGKPRDFLLALTQCKVPYKIVFRVLAILRFLPLLHEEAQNILCAAQMRGLRLKKTGPIHKIIAYFSIILPALRGAIHRTRLFSCAMEARAFGAFPHRTSMRRLRLHTVDWIYAAGVCLAVTAIIIFLKTA